MFTRERTFFTLHNYFACHVKWRTSTWLNVYGKRLLLRVATHFVTVCLSVQNHGGPAGEAGKTGKGEPEARKRRVKPQTKGISIYRAWHTTNGQPCVCGLIYIYMIHVQYVMQPWPRRRLCTWEIRSGPVCCVLCCACRIKLINKYGNGDASYYELNLWLFVICIICVCVIRLHRETAGRWTTNGNAQFTIYITHISNLLFCIDHRYIEYTCTCMYIHTYIMTASADSRDSRQIAGIDIDTDKTQKAKASKANFK